MPAAEWTNEAAEMLGPASMCATQPIRGRGNKDTPQTHTNTQIHNHKYQIYVLSPASIYATLPIRGLVKRGRVDYHHQHQQDSHHGGGTPHVPVPLLKQLEKLPEAPMYIVCA